MSNVDLLSGLKNLRTGETVQPEEEKEEVKKEPEREHAGTIAGFVRFMTFRELSKSTQAGYIPYVREYLNTVGSTQERVDEVLGRHGNHGKVRSALRLYLKTYRNTRNFVIPEKKGRSGKNKRIVREGEYVPYKLYVELCRLFPLQEEIFIRLMFESGLRVSEVCKVRVSSLMLDDCERDGYGLVNGVGKGGKLFQQVVSLKTCRVIKRYLSENGSVVDFLFPDYRYRQAFNRYLDYFKVIFPKYAGVLRPHAFRHGFATYLKRCGVDLKDIQEFMRHERLETTGMYAHGDRREQIGRHKRIFS